VPLGEDPFHQHLLYWTGQLQQPDLVRDGRSALAHLCRQRLLCDSEILKEYLQGERLIHSVEVLPHNVLNQGQLQTLSVRSFPNNSRYHRVSGHLRSPPATLARDQFVRAA